MAGPARATLVLAALLYLGAVAVPCLPAGDLLPSGSTGATVDVFCPCHTGHASGPASVAGEWQGPRSESVPRAAEPPTRHDTPYSARLCERVTALPPPIPIV